MRKYVLSMAAFLAFVGFNLAVEVTFVKWDADKNEMTVKEGDKEATYKVTDKTTVKATDKDGKVTDVDLEKAKKSWAKNGATMAEKKAKLDITVEKDTITEIKTKGCAKGKDKN